MPFVAPWLLLGTLAAAVPIAIHLFYRSRYRNVPWAAMQFLLQSVEQTSRRLKFQELLLLLLRIALLVLLALALAQPISWFSSAVANAPGDAVDAVFLVDTSYSMAVREPDGTTRLDKAREAARAVLGRLPADSTVQVVSCSDRAVELPEKGARNPADFDQVRSILDGIEVTHRATDYRPGFRQAEELIRRMSEQQAKISQVRNKAVYLFSDMQADGWQRQEQDLSAVVQDLAKKAAIYLVRCGKSSPSNVSVVAIRPPSGLLHTGERVTFTVTVQNTGKTDARGLTVRLDVDGNKEQGGAAVLSGEQGQVLGAGETRSLPVSVRFTKPGLGVVTAVLSADDLEVDNRLDMVVEVRDQIRVLLVDGDPEPDTRADRERKPASYYLAHALTPVPESMRRGYHIQPRDVPVSRAQSKDLIGVDLCILANVRLQDGGNLVGLPADFVTEMSQRVRAGMSLMVFAGSEVDPAAYNRTLLEKHKLLPAKLSAPFDAAAPDKPFFLDPTTAVAPLERFGEIPLIVIGLVAVKRAVGVDEPVVATQPAGEAEAADGQGRVVMRFSPVNSEAKGRPAVLLRRAGLGSVMFVATSPDTTWTSWPIDPPGIFLAFLHESLRHLLPSQVEGLNRTVGEPLVWQPPFTDVGKPASALTPKGEVLKLQQVQVVQGRAAATLPATDFTGVYRIALGTDPGDEQARGVTFAVGLEPKPDDATRLRETADLEGIDDASIDRMMGVTLSHLDTGGNPNSVMVSQVSQGDWATWLLIGVVVLALCEAALAWFCGRPIAA